MHTKSVLAHSDVLRIMQAARAEAVENQWAVSIAIVDDGGHLLALERLDGATPATARLAPAKARTAALGRRESRLYEELATERVAFLSAEGFTCLEGAVPVVHDGQVIGAVGVSGVKSSDDARIAKAGIAAL
ncbi:heme-binding protein [Pseudomonas sp. dw_358]|uniref:GlcG/HbpS family heme-binding protein n=1 Tax=Pseudomonas sp. dw_358 TaxID=2720083 RepID=UPI001BD35ED5|nr:heme-binding protein [Pseudomonas sp. dw_358]